jgi:hypothetical protein
MGYEPSECFSKFVLIDNWPVQFLIEFIVQSRTLTVLLGLDFAEYVIPVFGRLYPDELTALLRKAVSIGREKAVSGASFQALIDAKAQVQKIERKFAREYEYPGKPSRYTSMMTLVGKQVGNGATMSVRQALNAVQRLVGSGGVLPIRGGVFGASNYAHINASMFPSWSKKTTLWQIKRIYKVMDAELKGKPYPQMTFPSVMPWETGDFGR